MESQPRNIASSPSGITFAHPVAFWFGKPSRRRPASSCICRCISPDVAAPSAVRARIFRVVSKYNRDEMAIATLLGSPEYFGMTGGSIPI